MQALEVTLRNALNEAVKSHQGGIYVGDDWWFEHIATAIQDRKIKKMSAEKRKKWLKPDGTRRKQSFAEQSVLGISRALMREGRIPLLHDDVISRLTFGYWVAVLGEEYEDVTNKRLLWPNLLKVAFSNTPNAPKRARIEAALKRIKELRNRMSHHEPIWKFYKPAANGELDYSQPIYGLKTSIHMLERAYDEILEVVRWMSEARYQSFIDGKLDIEFRKLCSIDGFYGFVNPSAIKNQVVRSRLKRDLYGRIHDVKSGSVVGVTRNSKTICVLGVNEPGIK